MQRGPVSEDELRKLIKDGIISSETRVWREGMDDWLPVSEIPELADRYLNNDEGDAKSEEKIERVGKEREDSSPADEGKEETIERFSEVVAASSMSSSDEMPPDYNVRAIVHLVLGVLCCTPIAIPAIMAIVQGAKVRSLYSAGDLTGAQEASAKAKRWCDVATAALVVVVIAIIGLMVNGAFNEM